jgi:hypothetical protein
MNSYTIHRDKRRARLVAVLVIAAVAACFTLVPTPAHADDLQTTFAIGETSHVGDYHGPEYKYNGNTLWYRVVKDISVTNPNRSTDGLGKCTAVLQRLEGGSWVAVDTKNDYIALGETLATFKFTIDQKTAKKTSYRFHMDAGNGVTGGDSQVFTISGELQNPLLSVKYSSSKQKYKKTGVKVYVTTGEAYDGKAVVYDTFKGKTKKLKTLKIDAGIIDGKLTAKSSYYTLSKKLQKGKHKIKVVFTAGNEFKPFYKKTTSKTKTIKVVK